MTSCRSEVVSNSQATSKNLNSPPNRRERSLARRLAVGRESASAPGFVEELMVQPGWYRGSPRERLQQGFQRRLGSPPKLRRLTLPEQEQFPRICGIPRLSGTLRLEPRAGLCASLPPWFLD